MNQITRPYKTLKEAMKAVQELKPKPPETVADYKKAFMQNPRLRAKPELLYSGKGWLGFVHYLTGKEPKKYYETLAEAMDAIQRLKLMPETVTEYRTFYKEDPKLPSQPQGTYKKLGWVDWDHFLKGSLGADVYETYEEAMYAINKIQPRITTREEYALHRVKDPKLPPSPRNFYKNNGWVSWNYFITGQKNQFYPTLQASMNAVQILKLEPPTYNEYLKRYKEDTKLPSRPQFTYQDWQDWPHFLTGEKREKKYEDLKTAMTALQVLEDSPQTIQEYKKACRIDAKLPSSPDIFYREKGWISWPHFLGRKITPPIYPTLEKAKEALKKLSKTPKVSKDYQRLRVEDPQLPAAPDKIYKEKGWISWPHFLTGRDSIPLYETLERAMQAVQKLDPVPQTMKEYTERRVQDPALPAEPSKKYRNAGWISYIHFLTGSEVMQHYQTLEEAMKAVKALKDTPKSAFEYASKHKYDKRLPASPQKVYRNKGWKDWTFFSTGKEAIPFYETVEDAMNAVQKLKPLPSNYQEYRLSYKTDPRLPSNPIRHYKIEDKGWQFFLKITIFSYAELRAYIISLPKSERPRVPSDLNKLKKKEKRIHFAGKINKLEGYYDFASLVDLEYEDPLDAIRLIKTIKSELATMEEYRTLRKLYGSLPEDPISRYGFDSLNSFLSFTMRDLFDKKQASDFCNEHKISNSEEYAVYAKRTPRLPLRPNSIKHVSRLTDILYRKPLFDVFDFEGDGGRAWIELAESFCRVGKGVGKKQYLLKSFFNFYKDIMLPTVEAQCDDSNKLIDPTDWYNQLPDSNKNVSTLNAIQSFFEYALEKKCADTSPEGEITLLEGYRMPIKVHSLQIEHVDVRQSETVKAALPFKYIQKSRKFILRDDTKTIKDIYDCASNLGIDYFTGYSDWFVVKEHMIDREDENCIWRLNDETSKYEMWSPVKLIATLTQLYKPFRGSQVVWLDSGEADEYKLEIDAESEQVVWEKNALLKDYRVPVKYYQGFLKPALFGRKDAEVQMHVNTNKTAKNSYDGYDVPFIDLRILPFILQLRDWQIKYNPIIEPKRWVDAKLTKAVSEEQLKKHGYKGRTCFLFRNPCDGDKQSPINQGQLSTCLSAILHLIEDDELPLTYIREGASRKVVNGRTLATGASSIRSLYTLHSMRVSLITAYIRDAKIAPEIVQKLVGHSSLVMTIYYTKVAAETIRQELSSAEELIVKNQEDRIIQLIRQKKIDQLESELVDVNGRIKKGSLGERPSSFYIFDYGICPNGATLCDTGGEPLKHDKYKYTPVVSGYLGERNCLRCRHFKTGPGFLGGLQMISNEISLECTTTSLKLEESRKRIEILDNEEYQARKQGVAFTKFKEHNLADAQYENDAKYFDGLVTDLIYAIRYAKESVALLRKDKELSATSLITLAEAGEVEVSMEDRSSFEQLDMICQSATHYVSSRPEKASLNRTQLIDLFAKKNGLSPGLFALTPQEQLMIGNEITNLLLARLGSYEQVAKLMDKDSQLLLSDLGISDEDTNIELLISNTHNGLEHQKQNKLRVKGGMK
jgi:hypothetical protein